jgi:hypothetical protein
VTILDALDDDRLFAPHFAERSWKPWRALLAALFGLPLDAEGSELYRRCYRPPKPPERACA